MFPLRDDVLSSRFPAMTVLLVVVNVLVFGFEVFGASGFEDLIVRWGLVPARLAEASTLGALLGQSATVFTSMFLHGDPLHLLGNMWFLWIFGDNIEDRLGRLPFLGFYLACGVAAAVSQVLLGPDSSLPMVGASGAIAGVLGAYLRLFPGARVLTLVPIFFFIQFIEIPAVLFLGLWFVTQIVSSILGVSGVAWWAHVFGFLTGLLLSLAVAAPIVRRRGSRGKVTRYRPR